MAIALAALPPTDDPMWPIAAAGLGDVVAADLADPATLIDVGNRIAGVVVTEGCDAIIGASPLGDRLAGAVASMHSVRMFDTTVPAQRVLVVDGVLATGAALTLTIDEIRSLGVPDVRAAVVVDLGATMSTAGGYAVVEV